MPFVLGLLFIPVVLWVMLKCRRITTGRSTRVLLNIFLLFLAFLFILFCYMINMEPFDHTINYSLTYEIFSGGLVIYALLIFTFTPFLWLIVVHYAMQLFRSIRVRKNAKIKGRPEFQYYRDDLDHIAPSTILFTSTYLPDARKSIAATILKLKLNGYILRKEDRLILENNDLSPLSESERMVYRGISGLPFSQESYIKKVEQETISAGYVAKNNGKKGMRIFRILLTALFPFLIYGCMIRFDSYVFENYRVYPDPNGYVYYILGIDSDIETLHEQVEDPEDYYYSQDFAGETHYRYRMIRVERLKYGIVRKAFLMHAMNYFLIALLLISIPVCLYRIIDRMRHIHSDYRRTLKGKELMTKAYALRNFLKDFTAIETRSEEELILWEYYLIYSVALGINVKLEDEVIKNYCQTMIHST